MLSIEPQGGGRRLGADERVDDQDAGGTLDERDVGQVEAADLVDARHHLEQAIHGGQA